MSALKKLKIHKNIRRTTILVLAIFLLAFYVIAPQLEYFDDTISTISHADYDFVIIGIIFTAASYLAAAGVFWLISIKKLYYGRTLLIQIADGFTNRLLPAGAGGLATSYAYLNRIYKSRVQAGVIVEFNNLIGFTGHMILLLALLTINSNSGGKAIPINMSGGLLLLALVLCVAAILFIIFRRRLIKFSPKSASSLAVIIKFIFNHPWRILAGLLVSMALTVFYGLTLYMVMIASNVHVSLLQAFLVLTVGVVAIVITPTPGGIGGVEAGLVAAQVSIGISPHQALSVSLLYRAITYWLPLLPGILAFRIALKKRYLNI